MSFVLPQRRRRREIQHTCDRANVHDTSRVDVRSTFREEISESANISVLSAYKSSLKLVPTYPAVAVSDEECQQVKLEMGE